MTNRITITGRLGQDAELRFTNTGRPVLNLSVGDGKSRRNEQGGYDDLRPTIWHRVAIWGNLAQMWADSGLLVKGAHVDITGELEIREYEHNGEQRWASEVTAYQVGVREPRQQSQAPAQQYQQPAGDQYGAAVPGAMTTQDPWGGHTDPANPPF